MLRQAATLESWRLSSLRAYEGFDLPVLGANQRRMLGAGVRLLGQPYVWAGETSGMQAEGHGGYDCSGFTWRIVNYAGIPTADRVALPERTSMSMSASGTRLTRAQLQPGDLLFYGDSGTRTSPSGVYHVGVYMGNGWMIHSSGSNAGVNIQRLDGWWLDHFTWGRRVLRRA